MQSDGSVVRTAVSLDEITARVSFALAHHPLCRSVQFDVVRTPRTRRGGNWTVCIRSVETDAIWEASDIVSDIQDAYDLATIYG